MHIYFTAGINSETADNAEFAKDVVNIMKRYCRRDWGDLCTDDVRMNEDAIKHGGRILAAYKTCKGKVYIITDDTKARDMVTTVLFADEY